MTVTRSLPVMLTEDELLARGDALEKELGKLDECEERKKTEVAKINKDMALIEEGIRKLRSSIRLRTEDREVECTDRKDWDNHTVQTIRLDTGEIIDERPMTSAERQMSLIQNGAEQRGSLLVMKGDGETKASADGSRPGDR
jgi:hypothetical protein